MTTLSVRAPEIGYADAPAVLRDVAFRAGPGEAVALLGGNGAGKTALLGWLAGLLPRRAGECLVDGHAVRSARDAVALGVGLVVQDPDDQLLGSTVGEDVAMGPLNLRVPEAVRDTRVAAALRAVGLEGFDGREIETLSLGERKRASVAGVLAMAPRVLLLDEPTAGLDPDGERAICATLAELSAAGTTLVVATHAIDLVPRFATRVMVLGEGRVLADGPCREVLTRGDVLARGRLRLPWPVELWARALRGRAPAPTLTLEEVLPWLPTASS